MDKQLCKRKIFYLKLLQDFYFVCNSNVSLKGNWTIKMKK
jgi:hypothetical protein